MTATSWIEPVNDLNGKAMLNRKRGDALLKKGESDEAAAEYSAGVKALDEVLNLLRDPRWCNLEKFFGKEIPPDQLAIAKELVEAWGARGGLLRRLDKSQAALESYEEGAKIEGKFVQEEDAKVEGKFVQGEKRVPEGTYNRVNAVKYSLLTGLKSLTQIEPDLKDLENLLTEQLGKDTKLSDNAWNWADLGDCRALLGDVPGAAKAYRTFVNKASSNAPTSTLEVLRNILTKLDEASDPRAATVRESLEALQRELA